MSAQGQHKETALHECLASEQDTEQVQTYERIRKQGGSLLCVSRRCSQANTVQCLLWKMTLLVKSTGEGLGLRLSDCKTTSVAVANLTSGPEGLTETSL